MAIHNPMCDGAHCRCSTGEVRLYPTGGGGNMIYCRACWDYQNRYRADRGRDTGAPENWPQLSWDTARVYDGVGPELSHGDVYCRWTVRYQPEAPVTGRWRATRHGVGMCANTITLLARMIDQKHAEETAGRLA